ncbi:hypothetical protein [Streptomyces afghaniensis]|uniref:hypothetical protein n=1 Tax=Streptomyces afghaniensis TaxID=66865 RepID=UPI00378A641F
MFGDGLFKVGEDALLVALVSGEPGACFVEGLLCLGAGRASQCFEEGAAAGVQAAYVFDSAGALGCLEAADEPDDVLWQGSRALCCHADL